MLAIDSGGSRKFWWGYDKIYHKFINKHKLRTISKFRMFMINVLDLVHTFDQVRSEKEICNGGLWKQSPQSPEAILGIGANKAPSARKFCIFLAKIT